MKDHMLESPEEAREIMIEDYGLIEDDADIITRDPLVIDVFEWTVKAARNEQYPPTILI